MTRRTEVPPTAGLPPRWRDLWPATGDFGDAIARLFGLPPPQLECSGTASLVVALHALKQSSHRRSVVIPAYTCPLVALAIAHCGLEVVLCDLAPASLDLDLQQLATLFAQQQDHILAVIPTHLGGRVSDVASVRRLADAHGIYVIEDAAQGLGATVDGQSVGLQGHAGFFSFAIGKGLNLFEGGALITTDKHLRERFRSAHRELIRFDPWMEGKRTLQFLLSTLFYRPFGLRLFYGPQFRRAVREGDWVAAVGDRFPRQIPLHTLGRWRQHCAARALPRLLPFLHQTVEQGKARREMLRAIPGITVLDDAPGLHAQGTWPVLLVLLPTPQACNAALERLVPLGLGVGRLFVHALPDYDYLQEVLPVMEDASSCMQARRLAATMLCISNSPWLDDTAFATIAQTLRSVVANEG